MNQNLPNAAMTALFDQSWLELKYRVETKNGNKWYHAGWIRVGNRDSISVTLDSPQGRVYLTAFPPREQNQGYGETAPQGAGNFQGRPPQNQQGKQWYQKSAPPQGRQSYGDQGNDYGHHPRHQNPHGDEY